MYARKQVLSHFLMALHLAVMDISVQSQIGSPAVGSDRASRRNRLSNEPVQARTGRVGDGSQANAPDASSILLSGDDNQSFFLRPSADCAGVLATPVALIHLDDTIQLVTSRAHHSPAQLMQHRPCRLIAAQAQDALQAQRANAILLAGDLPHGAEPYRQRHVAVLQDGSRGDGHLIPAMLAKPPISPYRPRLGRCAPWTDPATGPARAARYSTQASSRQKRRSNSSNVLG